MKRSLSAICGGILLLSGCKEQGPLIDFGSVAAVDSAYTVSPLPALQKRSVLIEEYTGQSCSNCPAGHDQLEAIANDPNNLGYVNIIGLYQNDGSPLTNPPANSTHDFRNATAIDISKYITGDAIGAIPCAFIDQVVLNNSAVIGRSAWSNTINNQLALPDSINVTVDSKYDASSNTATIKATVVYLKPFSSKQTLSVIIVEDSMVDKQEFPTSTTYPTGIDDNYVFTNVFRDMISLSPSGNPILDTIATKQPGQAYWRKYTYLPNLAFNVKHCRVIAFVSNASGGDHHIIQSAHAPLAP